MAPRSPSLQADRERVATARAPPVRTAKKEQGAAEQCLPWAKAHWGQRAHSFTRETLGPLCSPRALVSTWPVSLYSNEGGL